MRDTIVNGNSVDHPWFSARRVLDDVWMIAEPVHVNMWLILGRDAALLIDTGVGVLPLRSFVESITALPIIVVNSHGHFDHIGNNAEFDTIYASRATAELLAGEVPAWVLEAYAKASAGMVTAAADRERFDLLGQYTPEFVMRPWPAGAEWRIGPSTPDRLLEAGDVIDLGDRRLRVVPTPGHSADSITLLDERRGHAYVGDLVNRGLHYGHLGDSDLQDYARSVATLAATGSTLLFSQHWPRPMADIAMIGELSMLLHRVLDGDVETEDAVDVLNRPVKLARHGLTSITLPHPDHGAPAIVPSR